MVLGSSGDRLPEYRNCVNECAGTCDQRPPLSFFLRLTFWTCVDDCKYECQHTITDRALQTGEKIHQYHGKWPFYRLFGMQEPASVLFSIGNGYFHYKGATKFFKSVSPKYAYRPIIVVYAVASINTWVWSAVFHTRDLPATEKVIFN